jgi:AraC-like DNA-binding protein
LHVPARAQPTTSVDVVRACFAEAVARGQDAAALCARFGVAPELLADPEARVPTQLTHRIWRELPDVLGAKDFGFDVARRAQAESAFGVLGHLLRSSQTVGEGLRTAVRYHRVFSDAFDVRWSDTQELVRLAVVFRAPNLEPVRHGLEFTFGSILLLIRSTMGQPFTPRQLVFRHGRPDDDSEARSVFGCSPVYGASQDEIAFARADLELPAKTADPYLSRLFLARAVELHERLPDGSVFAASVRQVVADAMQRGDVGVDEVARRLHITPRTLQRRLRDEGTSHKEIVEAVRRELAKRYLDEGKFTLQQIAFVLGFSGQSSFHHAFVRWTGQSPGAYREAQAPTDRKR